MRPDTDYCSGSHLRSLLYGCGFEGRQIIRCMARDTFVMSIIYRQQPKMKEWLAKLNVGFHSCLPYLFKVSMPSFTIMNHNALLLLEPFYEYIIL